MVRTGLLQSLMPSISRLVVGLWLQEPPPSAGYQSGSARVRRREPQPGVTAGSRRMFQALGVPGRYPAVPFVSHWLVRRGIRAPLVELLG